MYDSSVQIYTFVLKKNNFEIVFKNGDIISRICNGFFSGSRTKFQSKCALNYEGYSEVLNLTLKELC